METKKTRRVMMFSGVLYQQIEDEIEKACTDSGYMPIQVSLAMDDQEIVAAVLAEKLDI